MFASAILSVLLPTLVLSSQPPRHEIAVVLSVDQQYNATIAGQQFLGPAVSGKESLWQQIDTHKKTVTGNGPWVVAVEALANDDVAALWAAIYLDGKLYTQSGVPGNKFKVATSLPPAGWESDPRFDDCTWENGPANKCDSIPHLGNHTIKVAVAAVGARPKPMWYPHCESVDGRRYFRVTVELANTAKGNTVTITSPKKGAAATAVANATAQAKATVTTASVKQTHAPQVPKQNNSNATVIMDLKNPKKKHDGGKSTSSTESKSSTENKVPKKKHDGGKSTSSTESKSSTENKVPKKKHDGGKSSTETKVPKKKHDGGKSSTEKEPSTKARKRKPKRKNQDRRRCKPRVRKQKNQ